MLERMDAEPQLPPTITHRGITFRLRWPFLRMRNLRNSRPFGVYWSKLLQHGILYPSPTEEELAAFYNSQQYDAYLSGSAPSRSISRTLLDRVLVKVAYISDRSAQDPVPTILKLAAPTPSICDVGCGSGNFLVRMRDLGLEVAGIDPSPISAQALHSKEIASYTGTAEDFPAIPRMFDVVTMFHSLEHCRDPDRAITNAASLLKPGGLAVIEVPNMGCIGAKVYKQAWYHTDAGRHLQFFTSRSLITSIKRAGLRPVRTEYAGFTGQFTPEWIADMYRCWQDLGLKSGKPTRALSAISLLLSIALPKPQKYYVIRVYALKSSTS